MTSLALLAKRALGGPARLVRPVRTVPRRWILTFHEVGDHRWATGAARFEEMLATLRAEAPVVPLEDLLAAPDGDGLRVALTFDDGYLGVAERAAPALERLGMPATVFLPTDLLQEADTLPLEGRGLYPGVPLMGWRTVRRLASSSSLRFESHGAAHAPLPSLSEAERRADLLRSRDALAAATGIPPRYLAYPYGATDAASKAAAREAGLLAAFTTRHGGLRPGADPFLLPRADVRAGYSPRDLLSILRGDWDFLALAQAVRGNRA